MSSVEAHSAWFRATAVTVAAAGAMSLAACEQGQPQEAPSTFILSTPPVELLPPPPPVPLPVPECAAPSPTDINIAGKLLAQPENDKYSVNEYDAPPFLPGGEKARLALAKKSGLHVFDANKEAGAMYVAAMNGSHKPFSSYLEQAQAFMKQYGVTVEVGAATDPGYEEGARAPTAAELETAGAKLSMSSIIEAFSDVPREYVYGITGLRHIVLMSGAKYYKQSDGSEDDVSYANTDGKADTVYLNIGYVSDDKEFNGWQDPQTIRHEAYHLEDAHLCTETGMSTDPAIESINTSPDSAIYVAGLDSNTATPYYDQYLSLEGKQYDAIAEEKKEQYCLDATAAKKKGATIETISTYHPNVVEEKAELGSILDNSTSRFLDPDQPGWEAVTDPNLPLLHKKFEVLLARVYQKNPAVARYLATISTRWSPPDGAPKCKAK